MAQMVRNLPAMQETWIQSLGGEDLLEKGMATHSSILGWRISWKEEPGRLKSTRSWRVGHNWATNTFWELRAGNWLWFVWDPAKRIWHSWGPLLWPQTPASSLKGRLSERSGISSHPGYHCFIGVIWMKAQGKEHNNGICSHLRQKGWNHAFLFRIWLVFNSCIYLEIYLTFSPRFACMISHFGCIWLFVTPWTVDCHAPLFMGLPRHEYWSRLPFPSPGDLLDPGIKPTFLISPHWQEGSLPLTWSVKPFSFGLLIGSEEK